MPSKGRKQRKDAAAGNAQANTFLEKGINAFQPFANVGGQALNQLSGFAGIGTPEQKAAAEAAFNNSIFKTGGETEFGIEKDEIDAGLANSGLIFSSARLNAVEEARKRTFGNAFNSFLANTSGLANIGFAGAQGQANQFNQQASNAFNLGQFNASTRKGFTQKLKDAVSATQSIGQLAGQASNFFSSDRRLKDDIRRIDSFGPLGVYMWRWNDDAASLGLNGEDVGFMADEVEQVLPEAVGMRDGYKTVDYRAVMERYQQ